MSDAIAQLQSIIGDRYVIAREIARGGMATVYLANDRRHGRNVALKVMDAAVIGAVGASRFLREIEIAARLTHPHILPLFDSGEARANGDHEGACLYYVMPFIAGESLRERMNRGGTLPLADVVSIVREAAGALDYAHQQGIVHRDIKPENVLLSEGHAVVADFGIARAVAEAAAAGGTLTQVGMLVGTPAYMSPEQADGTGSVDGRSDQYSLACVAYEMLAGRAPFVGSNPMALIAQHLTAEPPPLRATMPVPDAVETTIRRALAKDPGERFPSTIAFAEALGMSMPMPVPAAPRLPPGSTSPRPSRVPVPLTPLLGREHEVQTIVSLLHRDGVRLLTLHGPGGIGKTRLALEVALRVEELFPDGIHFIALADVRAEDELYGRIAQSVGLRGSAGASQSALHDFLRDRRALLVLDNFEQLADIAPEMSSLLVQCTSLKMLVTSQALLHLYGEHEFHVEPLSIPAIHSSTRLATVARSPAVRLFVERAVAARSDFQLDDENVRTVAEICVLLDGVPLALELAAARVKVMAPLSLLPRLRQTLDALTGGARDLPARQRTMRGAIMWTHDLLGDDERALLCRLAVFAGGATVHAVHAVTEEGTVHGIAETLESLADKSLVRHQDDPLGEARYVMLRPIHAFALEMLELSGERERAADRHAAYFRDLALEGEPHLLHAEDAWLDRLDAERANLALAVDHLVARDEVSDALRTAVALWRFWDARSYAREGLERLRRLIAQTDDDTPLKLRLHALYAAGILADASADYELGRQLFEEHVKLTEQLHEPRATLVARNNLAVLLLRMGDIEGAIPHFEAGTAALLETGDLRGAAMGHANIGNAERLRRNFSAARERYEVALRMFQESDDHVNVAWALSHLGDVARDEGDVGRAHVLYRESVAIFSELRHKRGCGSVLMDIAQLCLAENRLLDARAFLEESLTHLADAGDQRGMIRIVEMLADLASRDGTPARALRLAGAVSGLREALGAPLSEDERRRLEARVAIAISRLDAEERERAWGEGLAMSMNEVLAYIGTTGDV